jgi:hypothetical protein
VPPVIAQLTKIPKMLTLTGVNNSTVIYASNALDSKVKTTPVGITPIEGTLLFYVKLPQNVVLDNNTKLELSATDIYEIQTRKEQRIGDWLTR